MLIRKGTTHKIQNSLGEERRADAIKMIRPRVRGEEIVQLDIEIDRDGRCLVIVALVAATASEIVFVHVAEVVVALHVVDVIAVTHRDRAAVTAGAAKTIANADATTTRVDLLHRRRVLRPAVEVEPDGGVVKR